VAGKDMDVDICYHNIAAMQLEDFDLNIRIINQ
jgi:hypothetical protein